MSQELPPDSFSPSEEMQALRPARFEAMRIAAFWIVTVAGAWWFLGQLAAVMRPLLLAVFLTYVLMPFHNRLRRHLPDGFALISLAGLTALALVFVAFLMFVNFRALRDELPELRKSASQIQTDLFNIAKARFPERFTENLDGSTSLSEDIDPWLTSVTVSAINSAATGVVEALTAGLFLGFLLMESAKFPYRVRKAYPTSQSDHILQIAERINAAIISYMRAKVWASLALALPVWILLAACGVKFAFLWAMLTFLCNFIPYIGSVVAYTLPAAFGVLQLGLGTTAGIVAVGLLVIHVLTSTLVEPLILGNAVGISPLVILAALTIWGLLWGLPGMFLAVPLTVVLKIVCENIDATRPFARLLGD
ncbi:MAG: AI-2E family transporter [Fimbriiglobus sp.]